MISSCLTTSARLKCIIIDTHLRCTSYFSFHAKNTWKYGFSNVFSMDSLFFLSNLFFSTSPSSSCTSFNSTPDSSHILTRFSYSHVSFMPWYTRAFELNILQFPLCAAFLHYKENTLQKCISHLAVPLCIALTFRMITQKYSSWAKHSYVSTILRVYV